jgi:hypothetical protein
MLAELGYLDVGRPDCLARRCQRELSAQAQAAGDDRAGGKAEESPTLPGGLASRHTGAAGGPGGRWGPAVSRRDDPFEYDVQRRVRGKEKARKVLGSEATTTLDEMLDEVIAWIDEAVKDGMI